MAWTINDGKLKPVSSSSPLVSVSPVPMRKVAIRSLSSAMSPVWFGPWLELTSQRTFCAVLAPMMK